MKNRKRNRICLATAMILAVLFLFEGCERGQTDSSPKASGSENQQERPTEPEDQQESPTEPEDQQESPSEPEDQQEKPSVSTDQQKGTSDPAELYGHVLAQYSDMVQNHFYSDLQGSDAYESSFGEEIGMEIRTHEQEIYYAFYDIDGNGTMELIIAGGENGVSNPAFAPWNYDLYGFDGTNVVSVFPDMEFGYRTNFSLYENGIIEVFYSGSAAETGIDFYRIGNDGFTPELVDSFSAVGHLEGEEPVFSYFQKKDEITEEAYSAAIQSYEVPLNPGLDWTQIQ